MFRGGAKRRRKSANELLAQTRMHLHNMASTHLHSGNSDPQWEEAHQRTDSRATTPPCQSYSPLGEERQTRL